MAPEQSSGACSLRAQRAHPPCHRGSQEICRRERLASDPKAPKGKHGSGAKLRSLLSASAASAPPVPSWLPGDLPSRAPSERPQSRSEERRVGKEGGPER